MEKKGSTLQNSFLDILCDEQIPVALYLINGIKLQGQMGGYDEEVIMLKSAVTQMVYRHAVSTVVPAHNIPFEIEDDDVGNL